MGFIKHKRMAGSFRFEQKSYGFGDRYFTIKLRTYQATGFISRFVTRSTLCALRVPLSIRQWLRTARIYIYRRVVVSRIGFEPIFPTLSQWMLRQINRTRDKIRVLFFLPTKNSQKRNGITPNRSNRLNE